jgi:hypothetical protein
MAMVPLLLAYNTDLPAEDFRMLWECLETCGLPGTEARGHRKFPIEAVNIRETCQVPVEVLGLWSNLRGADDGLLTTLQGRAVEGLMLTKRQSVAMRSA